MCRYAQKQYSCGHLGSTSTSSLALYQRCRNAKEGYACNNSELVTQKKEVSNLCPHCIYPSHSSTAELDALTRQRELVARLRDLVISGRYEYESQYNIEVQRLADMEAAAGPGVSGRSYHTQFHN